MRRTKPTLFYKRTKNLRAVQLLLGHSKIESAVRYLGIDVDDALKMAQQTEVWALGKELLSSLWPHSKPPKEVVDAGSTRCYHFA